ncbi:MAG: hypothetical protein ACSLFK_05625 [Gemmatimonadaceae bacterium]
MDSSTTHLVGVAIPTLRELRSAVLASAEPEAAVKALREAGFAGGASIYAAFERWMEETGGASANTADLPLTEFGERTAEFFRDAGWGDVAFSQDEPEGVAIVDITGCWEGTADPSPGCQVTTGVLASFFGTIAGYPVAVLETECCAGEGSRCRFLMGTAEMMEWHWERIAGQGD